MTNKRKCRDIPRHLNIRPHELTDRVAEIDFQEQLSELSLGKERPVESASTWDSVVAAAYRQFPEDTLYASGEFVPLRGDHAELDWDGRGPHHVPDHKPVMAASYIVEQDPEKIQYHL